MNHLNAAIIGCIKAKVSSSSLVTKSLTFTKRSITASKFSEKTAKSGKSFSLYFQKLMRETMFYVKNLTISNCIFFLVELILEEKFLRFWKGFWGFLFEILFLFYKKFIIYLLKSFNSPLITSLKLSSIFFRLIDLSKKYLNLSDKFDKLPVFANRGSYNIGITLLQIRIQFF